MNEKLATNRAGRIVLNLVAAARNHRWQWHWAGIRRELVRK